MATRPKFTHPDQDPRLPASLEPVDWSAALSRRQVVASSVSMGAAMALSGCRSTSERAPEVERDWEPSDLAVERQLIEIDGRPAEAVTINASVPGPILRLKEGEEAVLRVQNRLGTDTSIHWHGLILPPEMDGVPGVSFRGIAPGESFTYRFPVQQSGTYWYHSHSGFQEQLGAFGAIIIDPLEADPYQWDSEHVIMLSDWTFEDPMRILARLKKSSGYYNFQRPTVAKDGLRQMLANRLRWGSMRMDPTDIADVTGAVYTYLVNGQGPLNPWVGLFEPGQRVRLRIINAAAGTYFDFRIPGLEMTVVQVDGQNVEPITVDEIRVAIAETYDVVVKPKADQAYTLFAEAMDRSGFARGTLTPHRDLLAEVPARRPRPMLSMKQMGMIGMDKMSKASMGASTMDRQDMKGMDKMSQKPAWAMHVEHNSDEHGPGNTRIPDFTSGRLDEPGVGLEGAEHRVLVYTDLRRLVPGEDQRAPDRELELHLTGNMERYIWGIDGKKYSEDPTPIPFIHGERLRLTFVNDTMMNHPMHLHGMWMELVNGAGTRKPRKHTLNIKPAERVSVDISVDAPGRWAMHCHILYHMDAGMFRVVEVKHDQKASAGEQA